ncbi:DUF1360 domain-containing protein [Comamonas kerstersii]|uniref:DUF1360 domain-containing protein n=1 Tax=Comamonas kerstersii TaxID=225992 RepID=A0A6A1R7W6_9BURK|nr:DUF1360 domain-containing protein [Comamonas kerstersii]KAB0588881.1 DUF1360 domain-containing protein [Comamonas kerstersii]MDO4969121.1 DUF1360 domain-containing protein [Comamonadaceae bacterium]
MEIVWSNSAAALWMCVVIAVAAASISYTITMTELFAPVRAWTQKLGHMIGYLFTCFYCMSHWVVIAAVLIYQPRLIQSGSLVCDLIVSTFFTITISALACGLLFRVFLTAMAMKLKQKEMAEAMSK